jgi:predicted aconitase
VDVTFAHIDSGFYAGQVSVDFAEFLLVEGGSVSVPTQTNASLVDFAHPSLRPFDSFPVQVTGAKRLMEIYEELGCKPTWSCAPYHDGGGRPTLGQQIIGSESNAVSFFNSVLGARTNKYGQFLDVCGAIVGRVPLAGLHTDRGRLATQEFRLCELPESIKSDSAFHHVLGIIMGQQAGASVPVISGLDEADEDQLKAITAAAATSGAVEMFHVAGVTPEAPTVEDALGHIPPTVVTTITEAQFRQARQNLTTDSSGPLSAVCLGTPHFSVQEFAKLVDQFSGRRVTDGIDMIITTSRATHNEISLRGYSKSLAESGVQIALDTCTYFTPLTTGIGGLVMTNSAKWAYYAPGILGVPVAFGSQAECVESAVRGFVHREEDW